MQPSPNDFHQEEVSFFGPLRVSASFRVQIGIDNSLREFARQQRCEVSTVWRHAAVEYLRNRNINPNTGLPLA